MDIVPERSPPERAPPPPPPPPDDEMVMTKFGRPILANFHHFSPLTKSDFWTPTRTSSRSAHSADHFWKENFFRDFGPLLAFQKKIRWLRLTHLARRGVGGYEADCARRRADVACAPPFQRVPADHLWSSSTCQNLVVLRLFLCCAGTFAKAVGILTKDEGMAVAMEVDFGLGRRVCPCGGDGCWTRAWVWRGGGEPQAV